MNIGVEAISAQWAEPAVQNGTGNIVFTKPKRAWLVTISTMVVDFLSFWLSFSCALLVTTMLRDIMERPGHLYIDPESSGFHATVFAALVAALMVWMAYRGHYQRRLPFWMEIRHVFAACIVGLLLDGFILYSLKEPFSRIWVFSAWLLAIPALTVSRWVLRRTLDEMGIWSIPTAAFGAPDATERVREVFEREHYLGYEVQVEAAPNPERPELWTPRGDGRLVNAEFAVLCLGDGDLKSFEMLVARLARAGTPFAVIPPIRGLMVSGLELHYFFNDDMIMMVENSRLMSPVSKAIKRAFDLTVALFVLVAGLPFFLPIALWIRADGGPIFFGHARVGRRGRPFRCWKFRTMVVDADARLAALLASDPEARAEWERDFKLKSDPRITRFGRFLRRSAIDEFPQLINVVVGEMSLVGPRPIVADEIVRYGDDIDSYMQLRPGMTGLWQVSGRNDVSYDERVKMDRWYIRNWSIWHDVAILFKTVPALLLRRGAY